MLGRSPTPQVGFPYMDKRLQASELQLLIETCKAGRAESSAPKHGPSTRFASLADLQRARAERADAARLSLKSFMLKSLRSKGSEQVIYIFVFASWDAAPQPPSATPGARHVWPRRRTFRNWWTVARTKRRNGFKSLSLSFCIFLKVDRMLITHLQRGC